MVAVAASAPGQGASAAEFAAAATQAGLPSPGQQGRGQGQGQGPQGGGGFGGGDGGRMMRKGWVTPVPISRLPGGEGGGGGGGGDGGGGGGGGRIGAPISMAQATVMVGSVSTTEFAFSNEQTGQVSVVVGNHLSFSYNLGPGPAMVKFADLNNDGTADLIVSDSAADSVLVFLGQANGVFGTGAGEFRSFAVGVDPAGITIGNVSTDSGLYSGPSDLIVADKGSDDVTILLGEGRGSAWTMTPSPSPIQLPDGSAPVWTVLTDVNRDGSPDLLVLNSGSDDVYLYRGDGGSFDVGDPTVLPVGEGPDEMFVGHFDHRPGLDLVTVNSGSNDLTFISSFATPAPDTTTYSSGGTQPDAAFAIDAGQGGALDLVVANGGDGRLALLQPGDVGLQLAGIITRSDLPTPTAIAPGDVSGGQIDVYAATAGLDAAAILQFDLGPASNYLSVPADSAAATNAGDGELSAQLLPLGDSPLDIVAVLWNGGDDPAARAPSPNTAYYARGEGQGDGPVVATAAVDGESGDPEPSLPPAPQGDPTSYIRFVLDLDRGLDRARLEVDAVAAGDSGEDRDGEVPSALARPARRPRRPGRRRRPQLALDRGAGRPDALVGPAGQGPRHAVGPRRRAADGDGVLGRGRPVRPGAGDLLDRPGRPADPQGLAAPPARVPAEGRAAPGLRPCRRAALTPMMGAGGASRSLRPRAACRVAEAGASRSPSGGSPLMDRSHLGRIISRARALALAFGSLLLVAAPASAQFGGGYGGGYGGFGGGYGGGYGGYGGGYGGVVGGYAPGLGLGGYGYGYGYGYGQILNPYRSLPEYAGTGSAGLGYPGIGGPNPYFSMGLSPLAVANLQAERAFLGRTAPGATAAPSHTTFDYRSIRATPGQPRPGSGSFGLPR